MSEWIANTGTSQYRSDDEARREAAPNITSTKTLVALLCFYCVFVGLIFHGTLVSMVSIWLRSETFAHGFLILPISIWLAWRKRHQVTSLKVKAEPRALVLVFGAGFGWLLANLVDVLVVQQLAFVAVLICGIWAIAGTQVVRCFAFPLGFLFFAVPMGSGLIPPMMEFTADTTQYLLQASGVPVLREGMFLYLPTGNWSVIEECSGVRYLIASVVLGLCYAHLTYNSLWRKIAFISASVIVPILANSARAYAVVMVGHLSEMRYGIGADHIVFGWVFFGAIMLLMFWIGGFWQEDDESYSTSATETSATATSAKSYSVPALRCALVAGLAMIGASVWPMVAFAINRDAETIGVVELSLPANQNNWQAAAISAWNWRPAQIGADRELDEVFESSNSQAIVGLHLRQYLNQVQGIELVNNSNPWRPDRSIWQIMGVQSVSIDLGHAVQVTEARVTSARQTLLIWSWYHIDNRNTANPYLVKLLEAKQLLLEGNRRGTRVFVATPWVQDRAMSRKVLQDFLTANLTAIEAALDQGIEDQEPTPVSSSSAESAE